MAKATIQSTIQITLELDSRETRFLRDVLSGIGGKPGTRRDIADELKVKLEAIGFHREPPLDRHGSIHFT